MDLDAVTRPIVRLKADWGARFFSAGSRKLTAGYRFDLDWDGGSAGRPKSVSVTEHDSKTVMRAEFDGLRARVSYSLGPGSRFVDERVALEFDEAPVTLRNVSIGLQIDLGELSGFTATPVPFRISLKGLSQALDLSRQQDYRGFAEGWVIDNGEEGLLVMRVPSGTAYTCFVPLEICHRDGEALLQIGSIGPDGEDHRERNCFLDVPWPETTIELPTTRFVFFKGDWKTGYEVFRRMVASCISRVGEPQREPCPISYNTYHDFGPKYDRARIVELMPRLSEMGFGLIHLDPGWETVWGSNIWGEEHMGDLDELVAEARRHELEVGCWTSVHCTDLEVHGPNYTRNKDGRKYYAEDFAQFNPSWNRLWGVCPASEWRKTALASLSRLGKAGFRFLNSDFHDWPWTGESCWSGEHEHPVPITRAQWTEALNEFYVELHRACPEMVIELHDHVESGEYRTPVWYLYDRPDSYDEKWAYEFMWSTYQDLMDKKLFSLYYCRLAEPIPLFLHMNASSDNGNALAFWYVASCVNHIGVGAILKSSDTQREAYKKAFAEYNARFEAFTRGEFQGIDELTHVHVYPDRRRAVILAFNLGDKEVNREFEISPKEWNMREGSARVVGGTLREAKPRQMVRVTIEAKSVALVDLSL